MLFEASSYSRPRQALEEPLCKPQTPPVARNDASLTQPHPGDSHFLAFNSFPFSLLILSPDYLFLYSLLSTNAFLTKLKSPIHLLPTPDPELEAKMTVLDTEARLMIDVMQLKIL